MLPVLRITVASAAVTMCVLGGAALFLLLAGDEGPGPWLITSTAIATIFLGIALAAGAWPFRRSEGPRHMVAEALRKVEAGDLSHRIATTGRGRRDLAQAFNRMADSVSRVVEDFKGERNKLTAVLETMADGVVVVNEEGKVSMINRAARTMLLLPPGNSPSVIVGNRLRDHELQQLVETCRKAAELRHGEVRLLGGRRVLGTIATPLFGGERVEVLLTLHDLTPVRLVETTRREFVANVSHELRSPLASVKAMVETLESGALEERERARDFLGRVRQEIDRMDSMVNDLLELARVESGQAEIRREAVDLRILGEDVASGVQHRAQAKRITLDVDYSSGPCRVLGDSAKLRQVLVNLVDNALKFTPEDGRVSVRVTAGRQPTTVLLEVADTGPGIAPEHLPHVFERFYKADRSRRDGGTGLGLAIANHIVRAHGGTIGVESTEGEGTTFTVELPAAD